MTLPRVAWLGLGNMGGPMSRRLLEAGYEVSGFDLAEAARANLESAGGRAAIDPGSAAEGADIVVLMLPSSDVVESVLQRDGLLAALAPGTLVVDMGSSEPTRTQGLAAVAQSRSIRVVDAPVSGGVTGAEAGTLTIMVGGAVEDVAELRPLLEVLGRPTHVGAIGSGHALKALNNLMSAIHLWGSSEAMHAAIRFGLDPEIALEVVNGSSGRSGSTQAKWPNFVLPESYDSGFGLRLMLKDMRIGASLADQMGVPHSLSDAAVALWERAAEALPPTADHTEVARWIRDTAKPIPEARDREDHP